MRKRHFLCKEITDMQWEVTDGKVSEKDGHTDMERTGMKTAIKKGIKIYSPKIKKQKCKPKSYTNERIVIRNEKSSNQPQK